LPVETRGIQRDRHALDRPSQALSRRPRGWALHPSRLGLRSDLGRIAEDLGFEVGMFAGSSASLAVLSAPT
jgi:hypothetical protein